VSGDHVFSPSTVQSFYIPQCSNLYYLLTGRASSRRVPKPTFSTPFPPKISHLPSHTWVEAGFLRRSLAAFRTLTGLSFCSPLFSLDSIPIFPVACLILFNPVCPPSKMRLVRARSLDPFRSPVDMKRGRAFCSDSFFSYCPSKAPSPPFSCSQLSIVFPFSALSDAILIRPYHTAKSSAVSSTHTHRSPCRHYPTGQAGRPTPGMSGKDIFPDIPDPRWPAIFSC